MRGKLITPIILLIALLFTSIINIIYKVDNLESMIRLCMVFVIFLIVGKISETIIMKAIIKHSIIDEEEEIDNSMVEFEEEAIAEN